MNLKTLQEQAREKFSDAYGNFEMSARVDKFTHDNFIRFLEEAILQAVTEAYKADEIEEVTETYCKSGDGCLPNRKGHEGDCIWLLHIDAVGGNKARAIQQAKQLAFLGEGEV